MLDFGVATSILGSAGVCDVVGAEVSSRNVQLAFPQEYVEHLMICNDTPVTSMAGLVSTQSCKNWCSFCSSVLFTATRAPSMLTLSVVPSPQVIRVSAMYLVDIEQEQTVASCAATVVNMDCCFIPPS